MCNTGANAKVQFLEPILESVGIILHHCNSMGFCPVFLQYSKGVFFFILMCNNLLKSKF